MRHRFLAASAAVAVVIAVVSLAILRVAGQAGSSAAKTTAAAKTRTPPRTPDGHPDLQGVWNFSTLTPLERPDEFAGKPFLTEVEAAEYEKRRIESANADRRDGAGTQRSSGEDADVARAYNEFWYDRGRTVVATRRTSLIIDPPDGKLPPMTPQGQKRASALAAFLRQGVRGPLDGPTTRPVRERCIWWDSEGPPLTPMNAYNSNFQLLQNQGHVVILMEMIHDARIIPLDGRPHLSRSIPQLLGDSRGRWEGDTLVIDTTNFRDKADFIDPTSFTDKTDYRGTGPNVHLVERLTRVDADTLLYAYTVEDPTTWTRPWTAQQVVTKIPSPIYEYACHEGNYGMAGILSGARAEEKAAAEAAAKKGSR
jgi:hypothetical protein